MALLLTALSLLVVLLSAYLRLKGAGLGCADWPACYGRVLLPGDAREQPFGVARVLHRAAASLSLLLACTLVWQCWRRPVLRVPARPATLLLLLMLLLSVLGIWSSDPRLVLVGFLNILGGLGLVTFSWRVVLASGPRAKGRGGLAPSILLRLGAAVLSMTVILGALIGAGYAALGCTSFPDCGGRWWPAAADWAALQPFATLTALPQADDPGGASLHLLHRYGALCSLLLLAAAALQRAVGGLRGTAQAVVLLLLVASAVALGSLTVVSGFSLWLAISHGLCAAVVLATVATVFRR